MKIVFAFGEMLDQNAKQNSSILFQVHFHPPMKERLAFTPREFADLFNRELSWTYRQVYAGRVHPITEYGRMMIPASEVEKILATAGRYEGRKRSGSKRGLEKLKQEIQRAWGRYVRARTKPSVTFENGTLPLQEREMRRAARRRLFKDKEVH